MPIYEYVCTKCSHRFEKLQDMKDAPNAECPKCGKDATRVIASRTSVIGGRKSSISGNSCGTGGCSCCG